jgi:L-lactate dehydrogenase complex protein LldG
MNSAPRTQAAAEHVDDPRRESDLIARFVRELESVSGRALQAGSETHAAETLVELARAGHLRSAAFGRGIATNLDPLVEPLRAAGIELIRADRVEDGERSALRARIARCDIGIAEADYGIASTGTLAVAADATRPGALTLLPPLSVVILRSDRIVPDLAALFARMGPAAIAEKRLTLITGPSRTADIEKRIVMGVHGPRELCVILIRAYL